MKTLTFIKKGSQGAYISIHLGSKKELRDIAFEEGNDKRLFLDNPDIDIFPGSCYVFDIPFIWTFYLITPPTVAPDSMVDYVINNVRYSVPNSEFLDNIKTQLLDELK